MASVARREAPGHVANVQVTHRFAVPRVSIALGSLDPLTGESTVVVAITPADARAAAHRLLDAAARAEGAA
ncbi:Uncharacterised protein [Tsukamurella paurometabola]|uniref:Uncharacterized protein n=1 Tax=Tsukamurella paurometabola TaxID=2061 RepID=A0A3P8MDH8_TSUPA|nr:Uncharacterised protein [Tsukamurella paurometabola]